MTTTAIDALVERLAEALDDLGVPRSGYPSNMGMMSALCAALDAINKDRGVGTLYVGRSNDPDRRIQEHGADFGFTLYRTESDDHAMDVEGMLVAYSRMFHSKNGNRTGGGGGRIDRDSRHCIYVMVWAR